MLCFSLLYVWKSVIWFDQMLTPKYSLFIHFVQEICIYLHVHVGGRMLVQGLVGFPYKMAE